MVELSVYSLSYEDRELISKANALLVGLGDPILARRAAAAGFDEEESEEGWRLHDDSAARHRSFNLNLAVAHVVAPEQVKVQAGRLGRIDVFENQHFPQTRTTIRRFVPAAELAAVEEAFWLDLSQQPLGPKVVNSVDLFLVRLGELETRPEPWAGKIIRSLEKKGLTRLERTKMAEEVAEARRLSPAAAAPADLAAQVEAANAVQVTALADLRLWYNDVTQNLRNKLGYHDRLRLGLVTPGERAPAVVSELAPAQ